MKFKTTLKLFIAVCVLVGLVWLVEKKWKDGNAEDQCLLPIPMEDIDSLAVKWADAFLECSKKGDTWFIVKPVLAPANEGEIERILAVAGALSAEETVAVSDRKERELTLADYGFDKPRAVFTFRGGHRECRLMVGDDAPLGRLLYVKAEKSEDVIAVSREIMEVVPGKIEDLREKMVLRGDVTRTTRLEIDRQSGGFVQLVRTGEAWMMHQPVAARADAGRLSEVLSRLFSMEIMDFVWDAAVKDSANAGGVDVEADANARYEAYQLSADEAMMRVRVWIGDDEIGHEVFFGKQREEAVDQVFARRSGVDSVYTVSKGAVDPLLALGVADLRDKGLYSIKPEEVGCLSFQKGDHKLVLERKEGEGWMISEPVNWKADDFVVRETVQTILGLRWSCFADGSRTNLAELGLAPPACIVQVTVGSRMSVDRSENATGTIGGATPEVDSATDSANRLWIGTGLEGSERVVARFDDDPVKFGDEGFVFEIDAEKVAGLVQDSGDPLVFKDRTMLALYPASVKRISLLKNDKEQTVARNDAGMWASPDGVAGKVDDEAISDILFTLAHLRAIRIERHNPQNLSAFGLDAPAVVLTLGLTGSEAIQKSLIMGFRSKTDGIYAMVQGQDVVFVLDNRVVDRITGDLLKPPNDTAP